MSIQGYNHPDEVGKRINEVLSPAHPIRSVEHLHGRNEELRRIEQALYAEGRHVFIFGDRGVGKSSLGATAAFQYQSSDAPPIVVAGSNEATFSSVIANIANKALGRSSSEAVKRSKATSFEWRGLRWGTSEEINPLDIAGRIHTVADAAQLLEEIAAQHSKRPVVLIDEFDTIDKAEERGKFAHLLKHLGDQSTPIKLIFTGVGSTLSELLGAHLSSSRQLEQVELPRLPWEAREIVERAADAFDLEIDDNINWRIAIISDGFPYYVHLIMERMIWEAFSDLHSVTKLAAYHYQLGLRSAIASISAQIRRPYEQAVAGREEFVEDALWSTADGDDLYLNTSWMFGAYRFIVNKREREEQLDRARFGALIGRLKLPSYGAILVPMEGRKGWHTYRERMLRGYVRMQAEANGIELYGERLPPPQRMHVPVNIRTGTRGPSIPRGVRQNRSFGNDDE